MNNPFSFIQFISNPQEFLRNAMNNNQIMSNPMAKNALQMIKNGDNKGLENIARNLCNEKGINVDEIVEYYKRQLGLK